ncbi:outer membrane protein [Vibrio porteresiae]|uniref:Outer membrane beta-barrel protein n=1 Tax=Vibrio porteresiae DSM 19223 TaxID=1123496 RepID=A0ABZ0Q8A0_9VIBR|nr:TonB-dependent receptor [Vibrio porteresiae]WPC72672.1 outer membrane beta-barrel protein [Vibrio porteresiae DSM 19223]
MKTKKNYTKLACFVAVTLFSICTNAAESSQWEGLYGGVGLGAQYNAVSPKNKIVVGDSNSYFTDGDPQQVNPSLQKNLDELDATGSLILGYNLQHEQWLYGVEADLTIYDYDKSNTLGPTSYNTASSIEYNFKTTVKSMYAFSIRLQMGYVFDDFMVNVGVGPSLSKFKYSMTYSETGSSAHVTSPEKYTDNSTELGVSSNIGLSYRIDDNWSLRGDYVFNYYPNVVDKTQKFNANGSYTAIIDHKVDFISHNVRLVLVRRF